MIESYLKTQYKPFAINDIVQNLHNKVSKPTALKALETLVSEDKIVSKTFGKVVIYSCKDMDLAVKEGENHYTFEELVQLREELMEVERDKASVQNAVNDLLKEPGNNQLENEIITMKNEIVKEEEVLKGLNVDRNPEEEKLISEIQERQKLLEKVINSRKKMVKDLIGIIKYQINPKNLIEFLEDIGVEQIKE